MTKTVVYDYANRWIGETIFVPGENGGTTTQTRFVYDGNQIVAQFDKTGTGDLGSSPRTSERLWCSGRFSCVGENRQWGRATRMALG